LTKHQLEDLMIEGIWLTKYHQGIFFGAYELVYWINVEKKLMFITGGLARLSRLQTL